MKENHESNKSVKGTSPAFHMSRMAEGSAALARTYEVLFCHDEERGDAIISSADSRSADEMPYWG